MVRADCDRLAWVDAGGLTLLLVCLALFGVTDNYVPFISFQV